MRNATKNVKTREKTATFGFGPVEKRANLAGLEKMLQNELLVAMTLILSRTDPSKFGQPTPLQPTPDPFPTSPP